MQNSKTITLVVVGLALITAFSFNFMNSADEPIDDSAEALVTIKINRSAVGTFQGLFIAEELGYFRERGIQLEMTIGNSPDTAIAELLSGTVHLAMTGASPMAAAVANGVPVLAVLNAQDQSGDPRTTGLLVRSDSDIQSITDLRGKKVGMPGIASPQTIAFLIELEKFDMTRDDVELVNLPFPGVLSAIESGAVDAGMPVGLFYTVGIQQDYRDFRTVYENMAAAPAVLFAASKGWVEQNEDLLASFNEAMIMAYAYGNANNDVIRRIDTEQTRQAADYIATREIAPLVGSFDVDGWNLQNQQMVEYGFMPRVPSPDEYIWSGAPRQ
ncbi:MAG: twin-arginine translocation pathway signal protein [SAR86 cluster bacterium]|uniref:Twin-arginine translocation pathway signal protein n=1 Tax=SAR86 cluster bacterium TaxID=2030880 RepID=A0A2A5C7M2_9GAMM|nr:ABC transporter substrate-binding protein [bacterium AH-315-I11]PCJ39812.1 MAG: twin-arginine translocation pathway signal protein [SAR86 cluster bacterium]